MMIKSRRAHGDSHYFTPDGKRYWIVEKTLYTPNHAQLQTAVLPEDVRWKPSMGRRFFLHPVTIILLSMIVIVCFGYVVFDWFF